MGTNRYLIRPEGQRWILEHDGHAIEEYPSESSAAKEARLRASREKGEVVFVDDEGFLKDIERYGKDGPRDTKG